jgi:hypothetical protein
MKIEEYGLTTFKSTHYAIQAEKVLKENDIFFKTIPTPREVSHSCGLALLFTPESIDKVKILMENEDIQVDGLYKFIKNGLKSSAEKIN